MIDDKQVEKIAQTVFSAVAQNEQGRGAYLRALVSTVQEELGKKERDPKAQMAVLVSVHEQFYEIVLKTAEEFVPKGTKDRATVLHSKATFARTAASALRMHVKAGGDILTLKAATVTKAALRARAGPAKVTPRRLKARAERQSKQVMATFISLADTDKAVAIEEIQLLIGQLTTELLSLGMVATRKAEQALNEHRPLQIGKLKTLFMPTATQVIAQRARPS
jgi:predicted RNA-binding protein YlxR (DUF448 family)